MISEKKQNSAKNLLNRHQIRQKIKKKIFSGELKSGSKLPQLKLAREFGVTQGLIREALLELQATGLVEAIDNRGMFAGQLSTKQLIDSFDIREVLEGLAAKLCCETLSRSDIRKLRNITDQIHSLGIKKKVEDVAFIDHEFHKCLVEGSGNIMLERLANNNLILTKVIRIGRDVREIHREHLSIIQAIEDGRASDAEHFARIHIHSGKAEIERQVANGEFIPRWLDSL